MKLIKLKNDHYIIVNDSEVQTGDIVAEKLLTGKYELFETHTINDIDKLTQKKITHSTQPIEIIHTSGVTMTNPPMGFINIMELSLEEVKELIGEVDVFEKLEQWFKSKERLVYQHWDKPSFLEGYNQALEDNKNKKYTEAQLIWAIQEAYGHGQNDEFDGVNKAEKSIIFITNYLQPQTEWQVEFIDGKLKLK